MTAAEAWRWWKGENQLPKITAVIHHVAPTRFASAVRDIMGDHRPDVWLSDRYVAQQGHADRHQTCLAHLARDAAYALDGRDEALALWLGSAFALAETVTTIAASTVASRRCALERRLDDLLTRATTCDIVRAVQHKIRRARDQLKRAAWAAGGGFQDYSARSI